MYEEICYLKNNIVEVICRLDFANRINEFDAGMNENIYTYVKKYFPIAEPQDIYGQELQIGASVPLVKNVHKKQWVFLSRDRRSQCVIEAENIVFSTRNYSTFEIFSKPIIEIIHAIFNKFPDKQGQRFGLRYMNVLPAGQTDNWIDNKFFSALMAHKDNRTTQLVTKLEYSVEEKDLNVRLQYGYVNPDYPSIMKNEEFTIDIDSYSTGLIYDLEIEKTLEDMHFEVQDCFEKMITDSYRGILNEQTK